MTEEVTPITKYVNIAAKLSPKAFLKKSILKLKQNVNLFFKSIERVSPFPEHNTPDQSLFAITRDIRKKFNSELVTAVTRMWPSISMKSHTAQFESLVASDNLLSKLCQHLELHKLEIFEIDDTTRYSKNIELLLLIWDALSLNYKCLLDVLSPSGLNISLLDTISVVSRGAKTLPPRNYKFTKLAELSFKTQCLICSTSENVFIELPNEIQKCANPNTAINQLASSDFYAQFLNPIIEEVKANIIQASAAVKLAKNKHTLSLTSICLENAKEDINEDETIEIVHLNCKIRGDFPKSLQREPNVEMVEYTIKLNGIERSFKFIAEKFEKVTIIDENNVRIQKYVACTLCVLKSDLDSIPDLFKDNAQIDCSILLGLTGYSRMHDVCSVPPNCNIVHQLMRGQLPQWDSSLSTFSSSTTNSLKSSLNDSQAKLVSQFVLAQEGQYILMGPPGTGKTTTIIAALAKMTELYPDIRIMVCAPSNTAVHHLAERALQHFPLSLPMALTGIDDIKMSKSLETIYSTNVSTRLAKMLNKTITAIMIILTKAAQNVKVQQLEPKFQNVQDIQDKIEGIFERLSCHPYLQSTYPDFSDHEHIFELIQQITAARKNIHSALRTTFQLMANVTTSVSTIKAFENSIQNLIESMEDCEKILRNSTEDIESFMLRESQIIFCTLISAGRKKLRKHILRIDTLIIDEAGQATEPELLIPYLFHPLKGLQVGDTKQLPATIISDRNRVIRFDKSMMSRLIDRCNQPMEMLEVQYRMHPAICSWPSDTYYSSRLYAAPEIRGRLSILHNTSIHPLFQTPCLFVDVAKGKEKKPANSTSTKNHAEAEFAVALLDYLLQYVDSGKSIGVITFYRSQIELLEENMLKMRQKMKRLDVQVSTVDGFQGQEKDIIILSTVRTSKSAGFLKDKRRLNVAVTRPKHHLIILGKMESLRESNTDYVKLIHNFEECTNGDHKIITADDLSKAVRL